MGITEVQTVKAENTEEKTAYTEEEVQDFMKDYLAQRAQFTGTFDIFDEKANSMRNLEIGSFKGKLRNFGSLYIATIEATDINTKDVVNLDITAQIKDGSLVVKTVKFAKR
jgi:hypothetical protein